MQSESLDIRIKNIKKIDPNCGPGFVYYAVPVGLWEEICKVLECAPAPAGTPQQIKHMVDRFLAWKLPENFNPDGGVSFRKFRNENTTFPEKNEPVGTFNGHWSNSVSSGAASRREGCRNESLDSLR